MKTEQQHVQKISHPQSQHVFKPASNKLRPTLMGLILFCIISFSPTCSAQNTLGDYIKGYSIVIPAVTGTAGAIIAQSPRGFGTAMMIGAPVVVAAGIASGDYFATPLLALYLGGLGYYNREELTKEKYDKLDVTKQNALILTGTILATFFTVFGIEYATGYQYSPISIQHTKEGAQLTYTLKF